jgi:hypothetical protein
MFSFEIDSNGVLANNTCGLRVDQGNPVLPSSDYYQQVRSLVSRETEEALRIRNSLAQFSVDMYP